MALKLIEKFIYFVKNLVKPHFKIGIISYYYPINANLNNGVAIHTYNLSRKLAEIGCEVHVFAKGERNAKKSVYIGTGKLVIHTIDTNINFGIEDNVVKKRMSYFIFDNKVINEVTAEQKNGRFDIIHTHGWLTAGAFIAKYFNDIKWVHTFHSLEKNRLRYMSKDEKKYFEIAKWIESTIEFADGLIAVSQNLKKEISENYNIQKEKLIYIPNGVETSLYNSENKKGDEKKVLYVGRFSLEKGIDLLPKIISLVLERDNSVKFHIVAADINVPGSVAKVKREFAKLIEKYPDSIVWYKKSFNREDLSRIYKDATVYIQPSRYESFGLCVLEAMASGAAVICSDRGGLPEVVGNAGIIVSLKVQNFAKKILILLENFRLRERYVRRGINRAKSFEWEYVAQKTLQFYKRVAEGRIHEPIK